MTIILENVLNKPLYSEAVTGGALWRKVFLKISQNSQKNTCARAFFKKADSGTGVSLWILWNCQEHLFYWTTLGDCFWLFQNPFSWLLVYHFITLRETWMSIQCSIDFHLWAVAKYNSDWVCFKHIILLCYHIGKSWHFLKSQILTTANPFNRTQTILQLWRKFNKFLSFYLTIKIFNCASYLTSLMVLLWFLWSLVKFPWR